MPKGLLAHLASVSKLCSDAQASAGTRIDREHCTTKSRRSTAGMTFRAQNGNVIRTAKPLRITGCKKAKRARERRR